MGRGTRADRFDPGGPFPAKWVDLGFTRLPDWAIGQGNDPSPRTIALSKNDVQPGKATRGRIVVTKTGTDKGWNFRCELFGMTNKGHRLRYDNDWNSEFDDDRQTRSWDFNW